MGDGTHWLLAKRLLAILCLVACAWYIATAARAYRSYRLSASTQRGGLEQSSGLEPLDADAHYRLGRYLLFIQQDAGAAAAEFKHACTLNPYNAQYWLSLSTAYQVTGDLEAEQRALEQAARADSTTPDVSWTVGNFYLTRGETDKALHAFRVVIQNDPTMILPALRLCWRANPDIDVLLRDGMPPTADSHLQLLTMMVNDHRLPEAVKVWTHLLALKEWFRPERAFPYFDLLIEQHAVTELRRDWSDMATVIAAMRSYQPSVNLVVNGGFDDDILNGGLDWRYQPQDGTKVQMDNSTFFSGTSALAITFDGPPLPAAGIYQYVPVQPNTQYALSGYVRADDLDTASGPRISVVDAYLKVSLAQTEDVTGTTAWREIDATFKTGSDTDLVLVSIVRSPAEAHIRGKFWLDQVKLTVEPR